MAWYHRLINVVRPDRVSGDLEREIAAHLAERADDLVAAGMTERDAAEAARRRFGNRTIHKERARDADGMVWLESLLADFRYAVRALRMSPGFTLVAVLSLGLGIGANTAIFSLTNAVALKSLPVSHPESLMLINMGGKGEEPMTNPLWEQLRNLHGVLSGSLAYSGQEFNLSNGGVVRRAPGSWVSGSYFATLGVRPLAGRLLQPADDVRGCPATAAVSAGFAAREFGGAAGAVGRTLSLEGQPFEVVGVTDPAFTGMEVGRPVDIYTPICAQVFTTHDPKVLDARSRWYLDVMARPKPGLSIEQVRGGLAAAARGIFAATLPGNWGADNQRDYLQGKLGALPAATGVSDLREMYQRALLIVMVVVGVVLLIACANIANLLLARAAGRQREIAIRLAIGAGRGRLIRQLLTESLLLSLSGALLGVLFARWASQLLVGLLSVNDRPVWLDLSLDLRVLGFTIGVATLTGILFGLAPAWRAAQVDPQTAMKSGGRGIAGGEVRHRIGKALVVGQVALSLVLVAAAGLLLGSFHRLATLDPGFRREGVLLMSMDFSNAGIKDRPLINAQSQLLRQVRELPGVASASASLITPIGHTGWNDLLLVPGYSPATFKDSIAFFNQVSPGYFGTMGTGLIAGRDITADDVAQAHSVAVINETMAHRVFGTVSAIGRTFRTPVGDSGSPPREIVGVVRDAKYQRLDEKTPATAYLPLGVGDTPTTVLTYEVRATGPTADIVRLSKDLAAGVNPAISLDVRTLSSQVSASLTRPRLLATLSGFFGALALLLAVIGLYGTMSYNVTQRRNEIGIRMALGAGNRRVLRMVVGEAGRLVAMGIVLGAALAVATTRLLASFLYGLTATDPATLALSALGLVVIAMLAAAAPAWRAARLDPMTALRDD
jgi:putative ABC transport system permease protein